MSGNEHIIILKVWEKRNIYNSLKVNPSISTFVILNVLMFFPQRKMLVSQQALSEVRCHCVTQCVLNE